MGRYARVMQSEPITYAIEEGQLIRAMQHHMTRRLTSGVMRWLLIVAGVLMVLAVALMSLTGTKPDAVLVGGILGTVVGLVAVSLWFAPYLVRCQFAQSAALRASYTLSWDETALRFESERGHAVMPFSEFHAWCEVGDVLMLYQTQMMFHIVPLGALGAAAEDLRASLSAAGVRRF